MIHPGEPGKWRNQPYLYILEENADADRKPEAGQGSDAGKLATKPPRSSTQSFREAGRVHLHSTRFV